MPYSKQAATAREAQFAAAGGEAPGPPASRGRSPPAGRAAKARAGCAGRAPCGTQGGEHRDRRRGARRTCGACRPGPCPCARHRAPPPSSRPELGRQALGAAGRAARESPSTFGPRRGRSASPAPSIPAAILPIVCWNRTARTRLQGAAPLRRPGQPQRSASPPAAACTPSLRGLRRSGAPSVPRNPDSFSLESVSMESFAGLFEVRSLPHPHPAGGRKEMLERSICPEAGLCMCGRGKFPLLCRAASSRGAKNIPHSDARDAQTLKCPPPADWATSGGGGAFHPRRPAARQAPARALPRPRPRRARPRKTRICRGGLAPRLVRRPPAAARAGPPLPVQEFSFYSKLYTTITYKLLLLLCLSLN